MVTYKKCKNIFAFLNERIMIETIKDLKLTSNLLQFDVKRRELSEERFFLQEFDIAQNDAEI